MGKLIRFPLARRLADMGRASRVFEGLHDQERALSVVHRRAAQVVTVSAVLTLVLQVLAVSA